MKLQVLCLLIVYLCSSALGQDSTAEECEYMFMEEPDVSLSCNPYGNDKLITECTVIGPGNTFSIQWVWRDLVGGNTILMDSNSDVTIGTMTSHTNGGEKTVVRSRLTIRGLINRIGQYWCRVLLTNGTVLEQTSNILQLLVNSAYSSQGNFSCHENEVLSDGSDDCIFPVTGDIAQTTTPPISEEPTTTPRLETTSTQPLNQTSPSDQPGLGTALYSVIAVIVVFCAVIVTLTVTIVLLYRRKCARVDIKTADHRVVNPYSGFTQEGDRIDNNHSNGISRDRPLSVTSSTHSTRPHHHTTHSPAPLINASISPQNSTEEPYSKLVHAANLPNSQSGETLPGYSKLAVGEEQPPARPPKLVGSKFKSPPPDEMLSSEPQRVSCIYSDLNDQDLELGVRREIQRSPPQVPPLNIYNTLEGPGRIVNNSRPSTRASHPDYEAVLPVQASQRSTQNRLFDDPEYSPLKEAKGKSKFEIVDPRYVGDYERSPIYTCPTVTVNANELDPKYRGDYEWDPTYIPKPPPRRASFSSDQTRRISQKHDAVLRRKSLEAEAMYKYRGDYERSPTYVPPPLMRKDLDPSMLGRKYSGNYERDPLYMASLVKKAQQEKLSSGEYSHPYNMEAIDGSPRNSQEYVALTEVVVNEPEKLTSLHPPYSEGDDDTFDQGTFMDL